MEAPTGRVVVPNFHPAFCLRTPHYWPVYDIFTQRAVGYARGKLKPTPWPKIIIDEGAEMTRELRRLAKTKVVDVDVETAGVDPFESRLLCIGVGDERGAASVPWPPQNNEHRIAVANILRDKRIAKSFHNCLFDMIALEANELPIVGEIHDTILSHAVLAPYLMHRLDFVSATETWTEAWKALFRVRSDAKGAARFEKSDPRVLRLYNGKDVVSTARARVSHAKRLARKWKGPELYDRYRRQVAIALKMTRHGIAVDTKDIRNRRGELVREGRLNMHRRKLRRKMAEARRDFRLVSCKVDPKWAEINLSSTPQLRDYFFNSLGVKPTTRSINTNDPSLNETVLLPLTTSANALTAYSARALLRYRRWAKLYRSYVKNLPISNITKRVHYNWKPWGAITGRWAGPMMTIPKPVIRKTKAGEKKVIVPGLRDLFCASPGNFWVEADYSQLELRIIALLAGDELLLQMYADDKDVHHYNAMELFNTKDPTKDQRDLAKRFVYGCNYGGDPETIWRSLVVDFPALSLSLVIQIHKRWFRRHHWIVDWQQSQLRSVRELGYLQFPLSGRRIPFPDLNNVKPTEVYNYPVQGSAADIMDESLEEIDRDIRWGKEAILTQVHDSVSCEGPDPLRLMALMRKNMERRVKLGVGEMLFKVDFKIGKNYGEAIPVDSAEHAAKLVVQLTKR